MVETIFLAILGDAELEIGIGVFRAIAFVAAVEACRGGALSVPELTSPLLELAPVLPPMKKLRDAIDQVGEVGEEVEGDENGKLEAGDRDSDSGEHGEDPDFHGEDEEEEKGEIRQDGGEGEEEGEVVEVTRELHREKVQRDPLADDERVDVD